MDRRAWRATVHGVAKSWALSMQGHIAQWLQRGEEGKGHIKCMGLAHTNCYVGSKKQGSVIQQREF